MKAYRIKYGYHSYHENNMYGEWSVLREENSEEYMVYTKGDGIPKRVYDKLMDLIELQYFGELSGHADHPDNPKILAFRKAKEHLPIPTRFKELQDHLREVMLVVQKEFNRFRTRNLICEPFAEVSDYHTVTMNELIYIN